MPLHSRLLRKAYSKEKPLPRRTVKLLASVVQRQILGHLNNNLASPHGKRVARFIELFSEAQWLSESFRYFFDTVDTMHDFLYKSSNAKVSSHRPLTSTGYSFPNFPEMQSHNERLNRVLAELHKLVSRYKWHPVVTFQLYGTSILGVMDHWHCTTENDDWENYAIWWLSAKNGEHVARFRKCKNCGKWFFAVTQHQSFCTDACRKRHAATNDNFKEKRAQYMREYRKQEKQRAARAQETARKAH